MCDYRVANVASWRELCDDEWAILHDSPQLLGGVVTPWGEIYFSADATGGVKGTTGSVQTQFAPAVVGGLKRSDLVRLQRGCEHLQMLYLSANTLNKEPTSMQVEPAIKKLTMSLVEWPYYSSPKGLLTSNVVSHRAQRNLLKDVTTLQRSALEAHRNWCQSRIQVMPPFSQWGRSFSVHADPQGVRACGYCGSAVDRQVLHGKYSPHVRLVDICRACGPVFDGEESDVGDITCDRTPVIGETTAFQVRLGTKYNADVPYLAAVILEPFEQRDILVVERHGTIAAGAELNISFDLAIPGDFRKGAYFIGAFLIVGTSLTFMRRPVHLTVSTQPPQLERSSPFMRFSLSRSY